MGETKREKFHTCKCAEHFYCCLLLFRLVYNIRILRCVCVYMSESRWYFQLIICCDLRRSLWKSCVRTSLNNTKYTPHTHSHTYELGLNALCVCAYIQRRWGKCVTNQIKSINHKHHHKKNVEKNSEKLSQPAITEIVCAFLSHLSLLIVLRWFPKWQL